jgi:hypothetical protein
LKTGNPRQKRYGLFQIKKNQKMVKRIKFGDFLLLYPNVLSGEFGSARSAFQEKHERVPTIDDAPEIRRLIRSMRAKKQRLRESEKKTRNIITDYGNGYNHFWDND